MAKLLLEVWFLSGLQPRRFRLRTVEEVADSLQQLFPAIQRV